MAEHDDTIPAPTDSELDSDEFEELLRDAAHVPDAPLVAETGDGVAPGTSVTDRVRLLRPLGRGGMGSVWVAEHLTLDKKVAVKFINAAHDQGMVKRFSREAQLCAKIDSPHAVRLFDHGVMEGGTPFIVMELLEGESLAERLQRTDRLSLKETRVLIGQVAQVLGEAHALGIIHRDIKPANIFLTKAAYDMFAKVLDFGIAKPAGQSDLGTLTATGTVVGTPQYMAPEQLMDGDVEPRSDLWALAVVAYEAITGRLPFHGKTVASLGASVSCGKFELPSALRPEISPELDAWFVRAFRSEPRDRFESADHLADSFAKITSTADGAEVTSPADSTPPSSAERAPSHSDRKSDAVDPVAATVKDGSPKDGVSARTLAGSEVDAERTSSSRPPRSRSGLLLAALATVIGLGALAINWRGSSETPTGETAAAAASTYAAAPLGSEPTREPTADSLPTPQSSDSAQPAPPVATAGETPTARQPPPRPGTKTPQAVPTATVPPATTSAPSPPTAAPPPTTTTAPPPAPPTATSTQPPKKGGIIPKAPF